MIARLDRLALGILLIMAGCAGAAPVSSPDEKAGIVRDTFDEGVLFRHARPDRAPNSRVLVLVQTQGAAPEQIWGSLPKRMLADRRFSTTDIALTVYTGTVASGPEGIEPAARQLMALIQNRLRAYEHVHLLSQGSGGFVARRAVLLLQETPSVLVKVRQLLLIDPPVSRKSWDQTCLTSPCEDNPPDEGFFEAFESEWKEAGLLELPADIIRSAKYEEEGLGTFPKGAQVVYLPKGRSPKPGKTRPDDPLLAILADQMARPGYPERRAATVLFLPFSNDPENERRDDLYFGLKAYVEEKGLAQLVRLKIIWKHPPVDGKAGQEKKAREMGRRERADLVVWGQIEDQGLNLMLERMAKRPTVRPYSELGIPEEIPIHAFARLRTAIPLTNPIVFSSLGTDEVDALSRLITVNALQISGDYERGLSLLEEEGERLNERFPNLVPLLTARFLLSTARYPAERARLDQAIEWLKKLLRINSFEEVPELYAISSEAIGQAYWRRAFMSDQDDLQRAVASYEAALSVWTNEDYPERYARAQRGLGNALRDMPAADTTENLERALAAYDEALSIWKYKVHLYERAGTNHAKALAHLRLAELAENDSGRNKHSRAAASLLHSALSAYEKETHPVEYATTYYVLGRVYTSLPPDSEGKNFKNAVGSYQAALSIYTELEDPAAYAAVQSDLGFAYWKMTTGDIAGNIRKAVGSLEEALRYQLPETRPLTYIKTQQQLGRAYFELPTDNRAEVLPDSVTAFQAALAGLANLKHRRAERATTEWHLGRAYLDWQAGDRSSHLESAIRHLNEAQSFFTKEDYPERYAKIQTQLAMAHWLMPSGDRAQTLRDALGHYKKALSIYTVEEYPSHYAATQNNIGISYMELPGSDREKNLKSSVEAFEKALTVLRRSEVPFQYAVTKSNISLAYWHLSELNPDGTDPEISGKLNAHLLDFIEASPEAYFAYHDKGARFLMSSYRDDLQVGSKAVAEQLFHLQMRFRDFSRERPNLFRPEIRARLEVGQPIKVR